MRQYCRRFLIGETNVRGQYVALSEDLERILSQRHYPPAVRDILAEAILAVALMADSVKLNGSMILQIQGTGTVNTVVAQATHEGHLRGLAHWNEDIEISESDYSSLIGKGRLVMTLDGDDDRRYQGVVETTGNSLTENLIHYFDQSEQLRTRFWIGFSDHQGTVSGRGMMLQQLPDAKVDGDDWSRLQMLADTVTEFELMSLDVEDLLFRLFHEDQVEIYPGSELKFQCSCSRQKVEATLCQFGKEEVDQILKEEGIIQIDCEFCGQHYEVDAFRAYELFESGTESSEAIH
ncbi:MAG: Hsp33 family molecular chaperone HslO [Pseudomonadota bacterium]